MKKNLMRAVLVASLSVFFAGAAFTPTPAVAADAKPQLSRAASKPLSEAQKAFVAKDYATMIAKVKEALALPDLTDYDKYIANYFMGLALYNSGDRTGSMPYFTAAAESSAAPAEEHANALHIALELQNEAKNFPKVIELGTEALKTGPVDGTIAAMVAVAYYNTDDFANAVAFAQKSIDANTAAGKLPERGAYQIVLMIQNKQKDLPGETKTLEIMSTNYGDAEDWGHLIDVSLGSLSVSGKGTREVAALYIYRLRMTVKADTAADDYTLMADLALGLHLPGDAQKALQQGLDSGTLSQAKGAALLNKANAAARIDEPTLAAADAIAAKISSSDKDVSVAEDYYGYGRYADAARVAQRAISKSGPKALEAQLLLGVAQAQQGDNTAAAQSLALVKGDASLEKAAQLWTLYATRKYGKAATTPAAQ
ncbi:MAG: tetratricopeptide repeat protein [Rhizomicrobium sp.]|jgi:tetratricopeptide (TPR) repeat protein